MKLIKLKESLLLGVFALGVASCNVQGVAASSESLANIAGGDSDDDCKASYLKKDKKAHTQADLTLGSDEISGTENSDKLNEKNSKERSKECVFLDSKNKNESSSNASCSSVGLSPVKIGMASGGTATFATTLGAAIYGFNKYKQSRESEESSTIVDPYDPSGLASDLPGDDNVSDNPDITPKAKERNLTGFIVNAVLWSLFCIIFAPLLIVAIASLINGSMGVRRVLLAFKLKKVWFMLEALVAKFWFNRSFSYNGPFSNIPVLYWYGNNCFINGAFYTFAAPELLWLYKAIQDMGTDELVNLITSTLNGNFNWGQAINAANNIVWNGAFHYMNAWYPYQIYWRNLGDIRRKSEAERIKKIAKICVSFFEYVGNKSSNKNNKEYEMDGKFSLVGKFNKWQFNEEDGSYKAKEKEILHIAGQEDYFEEGEKVLREDYNVGSVNHALRGFGVDTKIDQSYLAEGQNKFSPPYFEALKFADIKGNNKEEKFCTTYINEDTNEFAENLEKNHFICDETKKESKKVLVSISVARNNLVFTIQPKYKYNEETKTYDFSCWLLLDCHGRSHKILNQMEELSNFFKSSGLSPRCMLRYTEIENIEKNELTKSYYLDNRSNNPNILK